MADELIQYPPGQPFPGVIGRTLETSTPAWPARPQPPEGAPKRSVFSHPLADAPTLPLP